MWKLIREIANNGSNAPEEEIFDFYYKQYNS
jgi:hypothetical protein